MSRTEPATSEVLEILAGRHRFDPKDKEALAIWDTTEGSSSSTRSCSAFKLFLGIVGSLTLVVGGIGVSNIMNVVVEERTREIGIKMALGATPRSILCQFLVETLFVTAVGGAIGLGLGPRDLLGLPGARPRRSTWAFRACRASSPARPPGCSARSA